MNPEEINVIRRVYDAGIVGVQIHRCCRSYFVVRFFLLGGRHAEIENGLCFGRPVLIVVLYLEGKGVLPRAEIAHFGHPRGAQETVEGRTPLIADDVTVGNLRRAPPA